MPCARIPAVNSDSKRISTHIPSDYAHTVAPMEEAQLEIAKALRHAGITIHDYPMLEGLGKRQGVAAAKAFAMQGILKYHGMTDWNWRTAYMPSISVNNDAAYCLTLVEFDIGLKTDLVTIGGKTAKGRPLERVIRSLDVFRELAGITTHARVVSRNFVRASGTGKGLGTSAAASAALATAATAALFGPQMVRNTRFVSCLSRLLSGSGCRSAAGGIALWMSHPGISHEASFAVRLDKHNEMADLRLITIPLPSRIGISTECAHVDAPRSTFYEAWMRSRCTEVLECITAIQSGDWKTLGKMAELDSIRLHGVTMSGSRDNKVIAWEPENIALLHLCNDLRREGVPVYSSTDTGPTTVLMTHRDYEHAVINSISDLKLETVRGRIAGPAVIVEAEEAKNELAL